jgi:hypothetical protein
MTIAKEMFFKIGDQGASAIRRALLVERSAYDTSIPLKQKKGRKK